MRRLILFITTILWVGSSPAAPGETTIDTLADQAVERLQEYVRIDTINPPGNETRGVEFLAKILSEAGIESDAAESAPPKSKIWARVPF